MNRKTETYKGAALRLAKWGYSHYVPGNCCFALVLGVDMALKRRDFPAALRLLLTFRRKPAPPPFPPGAFQSYTQTVRAEELRRYNYLRVAL